MQLDDYRIPGSQIQVNGDLELKTEDIAGETSGTESVEKGIKPKVLRVSLIIRFQDQNDLNALIKKAESLTDAGERVIYTITHRTANAAGVRQVRFFDHLTWNEDGNLQLWKVSFSLKEYMSNPERVENRSSQTGSSNWAQYARLLNEAEKNYLA